MPQRTTSDALDSLLNGVTYTATSAATSSIASATTAMSNIDNATSRPSYIEGRDFIWPNHNLWRLNYLGEWDATYNNPRENIKVKIEVAPEAVKSPIVMFKYDADLMSRNEISDIYKQICAMLPGQTVLGIPRPLDLVTASAEELKALRDSIDAALDNKDYNKVMGFED